MKAFLLISMRMNYEKIYNNLICSAKNKNRKWKSGIYYERHHIVPVCIGGEGKLWELTHSNLVLLTAKEHLIAHKLLCLMYPTNNKLKFALWAMCTFKRAKVSAKTYERIRLEVSKLQTGRTLSLTTRVKQSEYRKSLKGKLPPRSKEWKEMISKHNKGKKRPDVVEFNKKKKGRVGTMLGKKHSEETKAKMKEIWERRRSTKDTH
jgi:hypothetical protein